MAASIRKEKIKNKITTTKKPQKRKASDWELSCLLLPPLSMHTAKCPSVLGFLFPSAIPAPSSSLFYGDHDQTHPIVRPLNYKIQNPQPVQRLADVYAILL